MIQVAAGSVGLEPVKELKVLLEMTQEAARSSSIIDPNAILRFTRLVDRATQAAGNASCLIREKFVKNPATLDDENAKIEIRKRYFLRGENKLDSLVT